MNFGYDSAEELANIFGEAKLLKENQDNDYFCPFDYNMLNYKENKNIKKA